MFGCWAVSLHSIHCSGWMGEWTDGGWGGTDRQLGGWMAEAEEERHGNGRLRTRLAPPCFPVPSAYSQPRAAPGHASGWCRLMPGARRSPGPRPHRGRCRAEVARCCQHTSQALRGPTVSSRGAPSSPGAGQGTAQAPPAKAVKGTATQQFVVKHLSLGRCPSPVPDE